MIFNVIFSDEADETFESIGQQIRARWGEKEVNEFRKRVYKAVETIGKFPLIFPIVANTENVS